MITLTTNLGDIVIELDEAKAPKTCQNFKEYVRDGHYDGTIFHRRAPIENEAKNGLSNLTGTIAMARTMQPHSATAQFFINVSDNKFLDYPGQDGWGYCVFGRVASGMDVVDRIRKLKTGTQQGYQDVPMEPVIIEKVVISE